MRNLVPAAASLSLVFLLLTLTGCGEGEQIRTYPLPTASTGKATDPPVPVAGQGGMPPGHQPGAATYPARMLVSMVEQGPQTWFFKLLGPVDNVAKHEDEFHDFVKSLKFVDNKPQWTTPTGWNPQGKSGLRLETFHVGDHDPKLELTVIPLGTMAGGGDKSILDNLNRWRGQLRLPPVSMNKLDGNIQRVELPKGVEAIVMDIVGDAPTNNRPGLPPMASGGGPRRPATTPSTTRSNASAPFTFDTPEGWTQGDLKQLRKAAFDIKDGDQTASVTVIPLSVSDVLQNVNRWRGQISMPPTTQEELDKEIQAITIDGIKGHYVNLVGEKESTLGAMIERDGRMWFFKLTGAVELAAKEKANFESFVKSVKFK